MKQGENFWYYALHCHYVYNLSVDSSVTEIGKPVTPAMGLMGIGNRFPNSTGTVVPVAGRDLGGPSSGVWDSRCDVHTKNFEPQGVRRRDEPMHTSLNFSGLLTPIFAGQVGW